MLIHGKSFTVYAWASTIREVACVHCQTQYVYGMRCRGTASTSAVMGIGERDAQQRAHTGANAHLQRAIGREIDAVPCPNCKRLQPDMIRMLRWRFLKPVLVGWTIVMVLCGLFCLIALIPESKANVLPLGLTVACSATACALAWLLVGALFRPFQVKLPPHRQVLTRDQAITEGYGALDQPYVYPDGAFHVHPAALRFPDRCCRCDAAASRVRGKQVGLIDVPVPLCRPCDRRLMLLHAATDGAIFAAGMLATALPIYLRHPHQNLLVAVMFGIVVGALAMALAHFTLVAEMGIPLRFRRYDGRRDSALLYCRNAVFAESFLAHQLQQHQVIHRGPGVEMDATEDQGGVTQKAIGRG